MITSISCNGPFQILFDRNMIESLEYILKYSIMAPCRTENLRTGFNLFSVNLILLIKIRLRLRTFPL